MGVPLSALHGRARGFTAEFVRDDDGRVVGMVGQLDPAWTDDDHAAAQAVLEDRESRCPGCGHLKSEAYSPDGEGKYEGHPMRCHSCAAGASSTKKIDDRTGLYVHTTREDR